MKKQGRPGLGEEKRVHIIKAKLTGDELIELQKIEDKLGMNRSDLIRFRLFSQSKQLLIDSSELLDSLNKIGAELGRSGNNINQLSRHTNVLFKRGEIKSFDHEYFIKLLTKHYRLRVELEKALRGLLKTVKN
ncbi:hypothetical protein [Pedobacter aquatilis]|uniref:hypothetical protein n=1 Tax=Pedobacter aquatilis TaxID=351343 RepID=UPI002930BF07|nr:hypothetical protein [Pedobacter aquatilis]